jgi:hypothetical protein
MIQFSQDISEEKLLMAFNNNVIRFNSDSELVILNCAISGLGINAILYPKPDGSFFFNFKEYITAIINTKNFNDTIVTNLVSFDIRTFTYNASDGFYINGNVLITINFVDASFETATRNLSFIAGVEQLETFKKGQIIIDNSDIVVLSPVSDRSNNQAFLKYWEGYPFEFSIFTKFPDDNFTIKNN